MLASVHPGPGAESSVEYVTFAPDIQQSTNRDRRGATGAAVAQAEPPATGAEAPAGASEPQATSAAEDNASGETAAEARVT